jgi:hypothetical protein
MPMNMRALSAGGELLGGLKQKQVMKAINIAHIARSFILEIYMYFKHSELEGISGKRKNLWLCRVTAPWLSHLVKSIG